MTLMHRLFPPPTYEMPDDVFFEVRGVLQLFAALPVIYCTYRLFYAKVLARNTACREHESAKMAKGLVTQQSDE
jgi:hypothetical protein